MTAALVALAALLAAAPAGAPRLLAVAAAADLRPVLEEAVDLFLLEHHGAEVRVSYGSSAGLAERIRGGASIDVLLSADAGTPAALAAQGLADGPPVVYAYGRLAAWVRRGSALLPRLERVGLAGLLDRRLERLAVVGPRADPYRRATEAALAAAGVLEPLRDRFVSAPGAAQVARLAETGEAEAAILPLSLALGAGLRARGSHVAIPESSHPPIEQAGVVLSRARDRNLARQFLEFLRGRGRPALARFGYRLPG